ncbi:MAG: MFS transporter [Patescibacteria group bacterium]|nr:MFS transporter [Patescibacteria group bacterium]
MKPRYHPFLALQFRDFRLLWLGMLISRIGSEMQVVALNWQIYLITGSALSLGLIGLSRFLPIIFFSLAGGMIADIADRKKLMIAAQTISMATAFIFAITTFTHNISPLLIYILLAINSIATSFETPARQSLVPALVPEKYFINAVSLNTIMWQSAMVIGPTIAGFIIALHGVDAVYTLNALSFLAVIFSLFAIRPPKSPRPIKVDFNLDTVRDGIRFVINTPIIYSTMLLDFFATFFASATVLLPIFAKDILKVGPQGMGILYAAASIGAVSAGLFVSSLGHIKHQGKILLTAVSIYGLATIFFGLSKSFYLSILFLFLTGAGDVISTIIRNTIRQLATPDHIRGRMVSINMIFFMGGPQLGETEAGITAAMLGAPFSVVLGGVGTLAAVGLLALLIPKLRNYQGDELITK